MVGGWGGRAQGRCLCGLRGRVLLVGGGDERVRWVVRLAMRRLWVGGDTKACVVRRPCWRGERALDGVVDGAPAGQVSEAENL